MGWYNYINGLLTPNPNYMASQTEAKIFSNEEDRKNIWRLIKRIMKFSTTFSIISFSKNKELESKFIDETFDYWKSTFKPELIGVLEKINKGWNGE